MKLDSQEYEKFIEPENTYFNDNKKILELSYRSEQPVALVEWKRGSRMEYVIAVDYIIDKNELSWSRGYYYTDYKKAQLDFNRVKSGQYLIPVHKESDAR